MYSTRLLIVAGLIRVLARRELHIDSLNSLDRRILFYILVSSVAFTLVWRELGAIVNRVGFLFTTLGMYFLLRSLIRSKEDVVRVIKVLAVVVIVVGPLMWYQHSRGHNLFSVLGASEFSEVREGKIRAAGPFGPPNHSGHIWRGTGSTFYWALVE